MFSANYSFVISIVFSKKSWWKNDDSFCYPFYSYDDEAIRAIKDLGFKLAFAGGNRKATRSSNKYLIPRYPIYKSTTLQQFINMVS